VSDAKKDAIQGFVKGRRISGVYQWAFPQSTGTLTGKSAPRAVTTFLLVTKGLHIGYWLSNDPWITAELRFQDDRGLAVGL
jgi:hypothetical protein